MDLDQSLQAVDLKSLNKAIPYRKSLSTLSRNARLMFCLKIRQSIMIPGSLRLDHLRAALESGMHAITANKGPVVHAYRELTELARQKQRKFYFESDGDGWRADIFVVQRDTYRAPDYCLFAAF